MAWLRVNDPRGRTRLEELDGDRTVVGRSASCEVRIDDPEVGLRHVSILRTERGYLILNETDALPIWDGDSKVNNHFMVDGVEYRVGSSTLTLVTEPNGDQGETKARGEMGNAATVMADEGTAQAAATLADDDSDPGETDLGKTMHGPPTPEPKPKPGAPATPQFAAPPLPGTAKISTQVQGSGMTVESGVDSTRTLQPGPPPPSSTETIPGVLDDAPQPPSPPPLPNKGRTQVALDSSPGVPPPPPPAPKSERRTAPPPPRPNPLGSTPTEPPTLPPGSVVDDKPPVRFPPEPDDGAPPVRFPPPPDEAAERATEAKRPPPPPPKPASDSWVWRKQDDSNSGSGPSVYSLGDGSAVVHASSQSWGWNPGATPAAELDPQIDLPNATPPPPPPVAKGATAPPPAPEPEPEPEPQGNAAPEPAREAPRQPVATQPRVEPVLLRPDHDEPPLPAVSKELSSGHSWMWALPQSVRDGADATGSRARGRAVLTAGIVLTLIGAALIGVSFIAGLTPDAIAAALQGGGLP